MLDLDLFKRVNDTFGHPIGDIVLQDFAQVCRNNIRTIDLICRYGGEEITILLPETEMVTAVHIAERLRTAISENQTHINGHTIKITASIGVATKDDNTLELETLIARADQAMYIAKHKGRNRVAVSR
jgi:diguanylate cyclase (GGDEF)-like protein